MRLYSALILSIILSTACGLKCYTCVSTDPHCHKVSLCPQLLDQCFTVNVTGFITKGCRKSNSCIKPISCCGTDMCNGSPAVGPTGPTVTLLLVTSAMASVFL